jgi:hypothetical protein
VTRIEQDGTMLRRVVDTAQCDDCLQWGRLAARALGVPAALPAGSGHRGVSRVRG